MSDMEKLAEILDAQHVPAENRQVRGEPLCKIARENGGTVPIACLFTCERNCVGAERDTRDHTGRVVTPLGALPEDDS